MGEAAALFGPQQPRQAYLDLGIYWMGGRRPAGLPRLPKRYLPRDELPRYLGSNSESMG